jgi:hypothetical protein
MHRRARRVGPDANIEFDFQLSFIASVRLAYRANPAQHLFTLGVTQFMQHRMAMPSTLVSDPRDRIGDTELCFQRSILDLAAQPWE